ncbi:MAG TPA: metallophosphoesterase [Sedimentisphaerales bacterium]|jgi:3',5'-cyclic AMP phosphodiesterase CpdA|nr:metallophosphoesterase [Sedimentisphaerales bacterium]HNU29265.1 metallophosphoesterase [Sedimentisphaerales bacterium]
MLKALTRRWDKRRFLTMSLAAAGGMLTLPHGCNRSARRPDTTRWAFLSDTHIHGNPHYRFRGFSTYENLQRVADQIGEDMPEGLVITGDLARSKGSSEAYENFKSLLAPIARHRPVHLCVGNHDHREDFVQAFTGSAGTAAIKDRHIVTAMAGPIRMIVLDTLLYVNTFPGMLGKLQRLWLETYLGASDETPTILFCHHAPRADLLDTRRLFEIISPARKVKALVFGHSHRYEFTQRDGIHLINLPATGYNFTSAQPVGWVEARLTREGGEFTLHAVGGNMSQHGSTRSLHWRA